MLRSIWQILRGAYSQRRNGIDTANIEHLRADLRFRLAMVEYAYYGRSGKRVSRCLVELKAVLGKKAAQRYLRALDPDLRAQFVERFQGLRRRTESATGSQGRATGSNSLANSLAAASSLRRPDSPKQLSSNVVPIDYATRMSRDADSGQSAENQSLVNHSSRSADSGD